MKLMEAFQEYADTAGRLRTPASRSSFRYVLGALQRDNPTVPLSRYTPEILTRFCLKGDPAPGTIRHRRTVLRSFFEWATWKGYCKTDPAAPLKFMVSPGKHKVRPGHWLDESDVVRVIRACPDTMTGRRDRLVLMVGFFMGLRRAALSALTWSQFSDDLRELHLMVKGQKLTSKGVPPQLRQALLEWRQEAPEGAVAVFPTLGESGLQGRALWADWSRPLGRGGIRKVLERAGERVGLEITPHDMRRSMAGVMEAQGADVMKIRRALDHSSVGTTSIYLDQNPNRTREATEGLVLEL